MGFSLQYEMGAGNMLTMLDLGRIPLHSEERTLDDPLILAGGPCAQNPEPLAPFIDVFVTGDGEPSLPEICDKWLDLKSRYRHASRSVRGGPASRGIAGAGGHRPLCLRAAVLRARVSRRTIRSTAADHGRCPRDDRTLRDC